MIAGSKSHFALSTPRKLSNFPAVNNNMKTTPGCKGFKHPFYNDARFCVLVLNYVYKRD